MKELRKKAYKKWMKVVRFLGTINGYFIFGMLYLFIIGLYALPVACINVFKKNKAVRSYWNHDHENDLEGIKEAQRLF